MLLTVKQAAQLLQVCAHTVYAKVRSGELKSMRVGRSIRLPLDQFNDVMPTHPIKAAVNEQADVDREEHAEQTKAEAKERGRRLHPAAEDQ